MRIAIDTGGTFTDCVFVRDGKLEILKVLSTPGNPARAIADALQRILSESAGRFAGSPMAESSTGAPQSGGSVPQPLRLEALELTCGTTVGTNALLERRGGRVALITTAGFEDVIEIGRQARPRLYDFFVMRPEPLVPRNRRFGLRERVGADGRVLLRPSPAEQARIARMVARSGAESVAVCLLFSFRNPAHERVLARRLRARGAMVSVSHEILAEFREFERTATTVVNAYLAPVMSAYLAAIERIAAAATPGRRAPRGAQVRIMQSNGGIVSAAVASREPVRTILSGPAGGVLGAQSVAALAGFERVISFDMGGTSTDVALVEGELRSTNESSVAELPVAVPMLDIHTVGAGGGSIARFDSAGALRVGPESAGADPGPICYGRSERPTVTDAHLALGRLAPEGFLGGEFPLDERRTLTWMERARGPMRSVEEFALGVVAVANATMEKAIRVISIERGYDPREHTLVAFGGAGGLHACDLAAALGMSHVLVPKFPGALSALGILRADVMKEHSQTVRIEARSQARVRDELSRAFVRLERRGRKEMAAEGFSPARTRVERLLDVRYVGQGYELMVPAENDFLAAFHRAHERRYGYADPARAVEVVNVRARFIGATEKPRLPRMRLSGTAPRHALIGRSQALFAGPRQRRVATAVYDRARLRAGNRLAGPAIIAEYSATTLVPPGWRARVDAHENLVLERVPR